MRHAVRVDIEIGQRVHVHRLDYGAGTVVRWDAQYGLWVVRLNRPMVLESGAECYEMLFAARELEATP